MNSSKYCRSCLSSDKNLKMFSFDSIYQGVRLQDAFTLVTLIPTDENQFVCYVCARHLWNSYKFKMKCLRSDKILSSIQSQNPEEDNTTNQSLTEDIDTSNKFDVQLTNELHPSYVVLVLENEINKDTEDENIITPEKDCSNKKIKTEILNHSDSNDDYIEEDSKLDIKKEMSSNDSDSTYYSDIEYLEIPDEMDTSKDDFEDYVKITDLTKEMAIEEVLARKESPKYENAVYKCHLCYKTYLVEETYQNHMSRHSDKYGINKCDICHVRFFKEREVRHHIENCHQRKYECKRCNYICFNLMQATNHVNFHKGKKYVCEICKTEFSMPNSLVSHRRIKHGIECICCHCGYTFASKRGLASHFSYKHKSQPKPKSGPFCQICDVRFSSMDAYTMHLVLSSKHHVPNGCKFCGDVFSNATELKEHCKLQHNTYRPNKRQPRNCKYCTQQFTCTYNYKRHVIAVHPETEAAKRFSDDTNKEYMCEMCGKKFSGQNQLKNHRDRHTNEPSHKCALCDKAFFMKYQLQVHMGYHTKKKDFKCDICSKSFTYKAVLQKHKKLHTGIRPHKCPRCEKTFINRCDVKWHIRYAHDKVPWPKKKTKQEMYEILSHDDDE